MRLKGVVGIRIHNLKDNHGYQSALGSSPFYGLSVNGVTLYDKITLYTPPHTTSTYVYEDIKENLESLVEEAIQSRKRF
jgi:hypothetical protein